MGGPRAKRHISEATTTQATTSTQSLSMAEVSHLFPGLGDHPAQLSLPCISP